MDVQEQDQQKIITWSVQNAIMAPHLGVLLHQGMLYAPAQALIVVLPFTARAWLLFMAMAALTLIISGIKIRLDELAILGSLFSVPCLLLMAGAIPSPAQVGAQDWALFQVRMIPVLALISATVGFFALRRVQLAVRIILLVLLVLFLGGYPLIGLLQDEQKRKAFESMVQAGMIFYIFAFSLYMRIRGLRLGGNQA